MSIIYAREQDKSLRKNSYLLPYKFMFSGLFGKRNKSRGSNAAISMVANYDLFLVLILLGMSVSRILEPLDILSEALMGSAFLITKVHVAILFIV